MLCKLRNTLGPLFLILVCPPFVILIWYTNTVLAGSLPALWKIICQIGLIQTIYIAWKPVFWGSPLAWLMIAVFASFQLALMRLLPGKTSLGPVSPKGNVPIYKANGLLAFLTTIITFCVSSFYFKFFSPAVLYDNLGALLGALNLLSVLVCLFLYFKGRFFPSSSDSGTTGNVIFDYYWGTELYPQIGSWHLKKFITCRFGMMSWVLLLISYAAKQQSLYGLSNSMLVSVSLQTLYVAKFFMWETGYLRSLDIMHDRAGFYICWGCMVWVPCVYTSPAMYLVLHPIDLNQAIAFAIFALGVVSISINYLADRQRQLVRITSGHCRIWGKKPRLYWANYQTEQGEMKQNILLASGWWGIARHFHYVPEIAAAFFWSAPALFDSLIPYFYVSFLALLLIDRAFRDDKRCASKYGKAWKNYCELVPYKIIPYVV